MCTLIYCGTNSPSFEVTCIECIDEYIPSDDGLTCEFDEGCFCPLNYDPVCCDDIEYSNYCFAGCAVKSGECSGTISDGPCIDINIFSTTELTEIPNCGGFDYCKRYTPNEKGTTIISRTLEETIIKINNKKN